MLGEEQLANKGFVLVIEMLNLKTSSAVEMEDAYELKKNSREIIRNIPDELLFEDILVCLPVKSLIAYKSVCKTWLHTIESRSFIESHRRRHSCEYSDRIVFTSFESVRNRVTESSSLLPRPPSIGTNLIEMEHIPLEDLWMPSEMTRLNWPDVQLDGPGCWEASVRVLGPIRTTSIYRGLFICHDFLGAKIAICNPATRDYKFASPFPSEEMPRLLELATTHRCRANYGFGVAADGDYKVVVVLTCTYARSFLSYVYSVRQGAWKKIVDCENGMVSRLDLHDKQGFPDIYDNNLELCPQVFFNGCWHWMAMFKDFTCKVLTFNVDSEKFILVSGPPSYRERMLTGMRKSSIVSVLNDHLALLYCMRTNGIDVISVWMMMEYSDEESWINIWRVKFKNYDIKTLVEITYSLKEDSNGGIQIERIFFQDYSNKLVSCDEFGVVEIQQFGRFDTSSCIFWKTFGISAYRETLERASPSKHGTAAA